MSSTLRRKHERPSLIIFEGKKLLAENTKKLYDAIMNGETPNDLLLRDLLYNGYKYWESAPNKYVKKRLYQMATERQADMLKYCKCPAHFSLILSRQQSIKHQLTNGLIRH